MAGGISTGDKWLGSFHQGADGWGYFTKGQIAWSKDLAKGADS